jgi:hypothetical protein
MPCGLECQRERSHRRAVSARTVGSRGALAPRVTVRVELNSAFPRRAGAPWEPLIIRYICHDILILEPLSGRSASGPISIPSQHRWRRWSRFVVGAVVLGAVGWSVDPHGCLGLGTENTIRKQGCQRLDRGSVWGLQQGGPGVAIPLDDSSQNNASGGYGEAIRNPSGRDSPKIQSCSP